MSLKITPLGINNTGLTITPLGFQSQTTVDNTINNIYIGSSQPNTIYVGSTQVTAVYIGSTLVWGE